MLKATNDGFGAKPVVGRSDQAPWLSIFFIFYVRPVFGLDIAYSDNEVENAINGRSLIAEKLNAARARTNQLAPVLADL